MKSELSALRAQAHLLNPDVLLITTPEAFNAHMDRCIDTFQKLKVDEPETAAAEVEEAEPEPELDLEPAREEKAGKDRMHRGGKDRGGE